MLMKGIDIESIGMPVEAENISYVHDWIVGNPVYGVGCEVVLQ
jgi:hypothetical protein